MKNKILILTDYKGFFGSKQKSRIYRGGMDIPRMIELFSQHGYEAKTVPFFKINLNEIRKSKPIVLYTSSEDFGGHYKSYIEDIVYHLEESGITVVPRFSCLRAHNNKVAMELLRERSDFEPIKTIRSRFFGTVEELIKAIDELEFPAVIKSAAGAMSRGVAKAETPEELLKAAKRISRTLYFRHDIKELLRLIKYRNSYVRESFHRNKFIVQNLIPGLVNDWKVLVYNNRCYALYRGNRDNDFRASGSGKFVFKKELPDGMLDFAITIKQHFDVPNISLDIGYDGRRFHLFEFQFVYFGTTTLEKADFYFEKQKGRWICIDEYSSLEEVYVNSIIDYLESRDRK